MARFKDTTVACLHILVLFVVVAHVKADEEVCVKAGSQYRGTRNFTASGLACVAWKDITPALSVGLFPDATTLDDVKNYCRNPEAKPEPYCYTKANKKEFASCNIEPCTSKPDFEMMPTTCKISQSLMGFDNGAVQIIASKNHPNKIISGIAFPGCTVKLEGCKECRYYVKVQAKLPICQRVTAGYTSLTCPANCQSISIVDGSYNTTRGKVFVRAAGMPEDVVGEYWTTSNLVQVQYCQMNSVASEELAAFRIAVFTTTKEEHFSSSSGVIKSPNFPYGYFSRSEIYKYSVQVPAIDTNMTLLFHDWDLNASAGSKVTIRWGSGSLSESKEYIAGSLRLLRPALLIPSNQFNIVFETGSVTNWRQDQVVGFLAKYDSYIGATWMEQPDTNCGGYLSVSESRGGKLVYEKVHPTGTNDTFYIDCIWVVEIPKPYTKVRYQLLKYTKGPEAKLTLTLRNGITSEDASVPLDTSARNVGNRGVFLHLSGSFSESVSMSMSYVTYAEPSPVSSNAKCRHIPAAFYCPEYQFCLSNQLFGEWGVDKCKLDPAIATVAPVLCNAHGKLACKDKSVCYTSLQQCNGVKECKDGSDEEDCFPPVAPVNEDSNVAAIVAPIVVVFIIIPIVVVAIYLCKKKSDEKKDEELMVNRQALIKQNGNANMQGFDNLAMEMEDVPISMIAREEQAISRASSQKLEGAVGGSLEVHEPPRHLPRETQSYREMPLLDKTAPPPRGTQSYRFPTDFDAITELPESESPKKPRRSGDYDRPPPSGPPLDDRQRQYRKRNEKPMTLADYRPGSDPKKRHSPPGEDRTPEGRSFRGDQPQKYPPPLNLDEGPRSPGDGASGTLTPSRERGEKVQPRRPGDQLPGRETQSYRHPPTNYDHDPEAAKRPSRSYRFEPENQEIVLKPDRYRRDQDVRPKSRPKEISGAHKKTLGQYRPKGPDPRDPKTPRDTRDPKPPRDTREQDDPKQYKPRKYDQLPDRQTQSYRVPPQSYDGDIDPAEELRSKSYRFSGSQSELSRTPNANVAIKTPHANIEVSGTTSI